MLNFVKKRGNLYMKIKTILSILLTVCIVGTLLFIAIFFSANKKIQDTGVFTKVVTHNHNLL